MPRAHKLQNGVTIIFRAIPSRRIAPFREFISILELMMPIILLIIVLAGCVEKSDNSVNMVPENDHSFFIDPPFQTPFEKSPSRSWSEDITIGEVIDSAIISFKRTNLVANVNNPWQVIHGLLAFGPGFCIETEDHSEIKALDWILSENMINLPIFPDGLFQQDERGLTEIVHSPIERIGIEDHPNQFLAVMAELAVPLEYEISLRSGSTIRLGNLFKESILNYDHYSDPSFSILSYAYFLKRSDYSDEIINHLEGLILRAFEYKNGTDYCGGSHLVKSLFQVLNEEGFSIREHLDTSVIDEAEAFIDAFVDKIRQNQGEDGLIQGPGPYQKQEYMIGTGANPINASGHYLEWLPYYLKQDDLEIAWTLPLAVATAKELLLLLEDATYNYGALAHAFRGISTYKFTAEELGLWDELKAMTVSEMNEKFGFEVQVAKTSLAPGLNAARSDSGAMKEGDMKEDEAREVNNNALLRLEPRDYYERDVEEGAEKKINIVVRNLGGERMRIIDCKVSCGCSGMDYSKAWMNPGEKKEIRFQIQTDGMGGRRTLTYLVIAESEGGKRLSESGNITLEMLPGLRYYPTVLDFGRARSRLTPFAIGQISVLNVKKLVGIQDNVGCLEFEERWEGNGLTLLVKVARVYESKDIQGIVALDALDMNGQSRHIHVLVRGSIGGDVEALPSAVFFRGRNVGEGITEKMHLENYNGMDFDVQYVGLRSGSDGGLEYEVKETSEGGKIVFVKYFPVKSGFSRGILEIVCDTIDGRAMDVEVPFVCSVEE